MEAAETRAAAEKEALDREASRLRQEKAKLDVFSRHVKDKGDKVRCQQP